MARDPEMMLQRAEEVLARYGGSREAIAAQKRRVGRAAGELGRRAGRAVAAMSATGAGIAGYGLIGAGIVGIDLLIAGMFALPAIGAGVMLLPTRRGAAKPAELARVPLARLAPEAEDWLLRRRPELPRAAGPPVDAILTRLHELAPQLAGIADASPEAGEARRLIGEHLPRLVDAWIAVPASQRAATREVETQLVGGLRIVADELGRLSGGLAAGKLRDLAVEGRFLETRYRDQDAGPPNAGAAGSQPALKQTD